MRSIVLSLLLMVAGLFAGGAAHAQDSARFPGASVHAWVGPAEARSAEPASRAALAILRKCHSHLALQDALSGQPAAFLAADDCGAPLQFGLDDRSEMIWIDGAPSVAVVAYRSPRIAAAAGGPKPSWLRLPLRPPRA